MGFKHTKENYEKICNDKYDNKYKYILENFKNTDSLITVICPIHGEFNIIAKNHLHDKRKGCLKCNKENYIKNKTLNKDDVIHDFKNIHGDRYDYSLVDYIGDKFKIKIICNEHGIFEQKVNNHKSGQGCPKCKGGISLNKNYYLEKFKNIHGDRYDYSLVKENDYLNSKTKIDIICSVHGIFKQSYLKHSKGQGCPKCKNNFKSSTELFIEKSKMVHGDRYDYSLVTYINSLKNVSILCSKHGIFEQAPKQHIKGFGCQKCSRSIGETKIEKYLIDNSIKFEPQKKFNGCIFKKSLKFDFYLPDYNLCIEYDGIYHTDENNYHSKDKNIKIRDNIKNEFCKENNIKLLRINYLDYKNIDSIIQHKLQELLLIQ